VTTTSDTAPQTAPNKMQEITPDTKAKILSDLWMHQNRRMWDRLQLAATLQAGLLGVGYLLRKLDVAAMPQLASVAAGIATAALIHITAVDRAIRDKYRDALKCYGLSIGFTRGHPDDDKRYKEASLGSLVFLDSRFYVNTILVALILLDLIAFVIFSAVKF
jgi:hypothetical protein